MADYRRSMFWPERAGRVKPVRTGPIDWSEFNKRLRIYQNDLRYAIKSLENQPHPLAPGERLEYFIRDVQRLKKIAPGHPITREKGKEIADLVRYYLHQHELKPAEIAHLKEKLRNSPYEVLKDMVAEGASLVGHKGIRTKSPFSPVDYTPIYRKVNLHPYWPGGKEWQLQFPIDPMDIEEVFKEHASKEPQRLERLARELRSTKKKYTKQIQEKISKGLSSSKPIKEKGQKALSEIGSKISPVGRSEASRVGEGFISRHPVLTGLAAGSLAAVPTLLYLREKFRNKKES